MQTAAGSSVGRLVTGVAQFHNFALINVVRSERGAAELCKRFPDVSVVATDHPGWADEVREAAAGRPVSVALDPTGEDGREPCGPLGAGREAGQLRNDRRGADLGACVNAREQVTDAAGQEHHQQMAFGGIPEKRASDFATAKQIALALTDQFDVVATYGLGELADAVAHAVQPGKVGTVLVRPR